MDLLLPPYAPTVSSIADAAVVAEKLGIPHYFLDMKAAFRKEVVDYFSSAYLRGETPSPCIMCNKKIKLGLLAEEAQAKGADIIVTGHYADIRLTEHGVELHKGSDVRRDQSYFLFAVKKTFCRCCVVRWRLTAKNKPELWHPKPGWKSPARQTVRTFVLSPTADMLI